MYFFFLFRAPCAISKAFKKLMRNFWREWCASGDFGNNGKAGEFGGLELGILGIVHNKALLAKWIGGSPLSLIPFNKGL